MVKYIVEVSGRDLRGKDQTRTFSVRAESEFQAREQALTVASRAGLKNARVKAISTTP